MGAMRMNLKFRALMEQAAESPSDVLLRSQLLTFQGFKLQKFFQGQLIFRGPHPELWPQAFSLRS